MESTNLFQQKLYIFLREYHPYLFINDEVKDIIINRAKRAENKYIDEIKKGKNDIEAMEAATYELYQDLEFSPISYLENLYEELTGEILDKTKAIDLYMQTKEIFAEYGKDVEGSENEAEFKKELTYYINELKRKTNS